VPVRRTRLLDNALLYTDITRAVEQVVLVGDIAAAEHAISMPSLSSRRTTRLPALLLVDASVLAC
jgi:exodeoxyribonuclease V alpha subunit